MSASTTVQNQKGYYTSFNGGKLVLKCDKYDPKKSTQIDKFNQSRLAVRAGDENFIGKRVKTFSFFLF